MSKLGCAGINLTPEIALVPSVSTTKLAIDKPHPLQVANCPVVRFMSLKVYLGSLPTGTEPMTCIASPLAVLCPVPDVMLGV